MDAVEVLPICPVPLCFEVTECSCDIAVTIASLPTFLKLGPKSYSLK